MSKPAPVSNPAKKRNKPEPSKPSGVVVLSGDEGEQPEVHSSKRKRVTVQPSGPVTESIKKAMSTQGECISAFREEVKEKVSAVRAEVKELKTSVSSHQSKMEKLLTANHAKVEKLLEKLAQESTTKPPSP